MTTNGGYPTRQQIERFQSIVWNRDGVSITHETCKAVLVELRNVEQTPAPLLTGTCLGCGEDIWHDEQYDVWLTTSKAASAVCSDVDGVLFDHQPTTNDSSTTLDDNAQL